MKGKGLIAAAVMAALTGCSSLDTSHLYGRKEIGVKIVNWSYHQAPTFNVRALPKASDLDAVMSQSEQLSEYNEFLKNYERFDGNISWKVKYYTEIDNYVSEIVSKLRHDDNAYARRYLATMEGFYYDKKITYRMDGATKREFVGISPIGCLFALDRLDLSEASPFEEKRMIVEMYDIIRRWPVSGREKVLEEKVMIRAY